MKKEGLISLLEGVLFLSVLALNDSIQFFKRKYYEARKIPYEQAEEPPLTTKKCSLHTL